MKKWLVKPIFVEAEIILSVTHSPDQEATALIALEDGTAIRVEEWWKQKYSPKKGDYFVREFGETFSIGAAKFLQTYTSAE